MKKRIGTYALGVIGLVAAFFLARSLNDFINHTPGEKITSETLAVNEAEAESLNDYADNPSYERAEIREDLPLIEAALTEEEITEMIESMRIDEMPVVGISLAAINASGSEAKAISTQSVIDFDSLWKINSDVYAWISVPGTKIDYPILQHATDNTRYLNYNIDGSYGLPGCIYTENMNTKTFDDPHTVIYGHNMKNGSMFAGLHKFREREFFDKHKEIIIYTPDKTLVYEIFAAYVFDDRHLMYSYDFFNEDVYKKYLDSIFKIRDMKANINKELELTKDNKIITLVTCISKQPDKRLLVQAVLK